MSRLANLMSTHTLGIAAQVLAAAPVPAASVFLVWSASLEVAGYLAFAQALVGVLFTVANLGLRPTLAMDGVQGSDRGTYWRIRSVTTAGMVLASAVAAVVGPIPGLVLMGVAILKIGDAFVDLSLGFKQGTQEAASVVRLYALEVAARLAVFIAVLLPGFWFSGKALESFVVASCCASLYVVVAEWRKLRNRLGTPAVTTCGVLTILRRAFPFAAAAGAVSVIFALPRLLLERYYSGSEFGAAGIALLVVTFCGMAFYTSWIRVNVQLRKEGFRRDLLLRYLIEVGVLLAVLVVALYAMRPVIGMLYGIRDPQLLDLFFRIGVGGMVLNACVGLQNFFKATRYPSAESFVYGIGVIAILFGFYANVSFLGLFYIGSLGLLLAGSILALVISKLRTERG